MPTPLAQPGPAARALGQLVDQRPAAERVNLRRTLDDARTLVLD